MNRYEKGKEGESRACGFLEKNGYLIIERNYRGRKGEIDIIARKESVLVFVEVKSWSSIPLSEAGFSIDRVKRERMIDTARQYIFKNGNSVSDLDIRFDFIFIDASQGTVSHSENVIGEF